MFGFSRFSTTTRQILLFTFIRHMPRAASVALTALACVWCVSFTSVSAGGQTRADQSSSLERRLETSAEPEIFIRNLRGRVQVTTADADASERVVVINATTPTGATLAESDVVAERGGGRVTITVAESAAGARTLQRRVDLAVHVPARARVRIEAAEGAVDVVGDFQKVEARTTTGTIRVDVPSTALRYEFEWTAARPRIYSLLDLEKVREGRGGRYSISGQFPPKRKSKDAKELERTSIDATGNEARDNANDSTSEASSDATDTKQKKNDDKRARKKLEREQRVELRFTTERGVVIIGADPATVPADLRERTLTEAARLFIRSGNETLIDRVRRLAPNLVDEYAGTLSTRRASDAPSLALRRADAANARQTAATARLAATVTDRAGRPLTGLTKDDFAITVDGIAGEVTQVTESDAPFNLVLLLDVSGSVEERLDFIRRAALRFVQTASARDRVSIITFRDDVATISDFTADRAELTTRINTIQAGGATALYDALAYTLLDPLHRLSEAEAARTAIVVLSDGDDNRSFLSYRNVLDLTRETGTPVYPLYVPSGLIPATIASSTTGGNARSETDDANISSASSSSAASR
jgi:Mg-chelatase subunit ChlD